MFSVMTWSPTTSAGTFPRGLIARYSGVLCASFEIGVSLGLVGLAGFLKSNVGCHRARAGAVIEYDHCFLLTIDRIGRLTRCFWCRNRLCAARPLAGRQTGRGEARSQRRGEFVDDAFVVVGVAQTVRQSLEAMAPMSVEQNVLPSTDREVEPPKQILAADFRDWVQALLLPNQDNQPLAAGDAGIERIPLQHRVMLGEHRVRIFRPLRLLWMVAAYAGTNISSSPNP